MLHHVAMCGIFGYLDEKEATPILLGGLRQLNEHALDSVARTVMRLPTVHPSLAPILYAIPLQLFAYHIALLRGCDVDRPRNLAKSVTVE